MGSKKNKKKGQKKEKLSPQKLRKLQNKSPRQPFSLKKVGLPLLITLFTLVAFFPSLDNKYTNWDDDKNFWENELITTINKKTFWDNSKEIFKTHVIGNYNPLTIYSFALEQRFVGEENRPKVRHSVNLLLHLLSTFIVFWIGKRLKLGITGAAILAILFGLHPMRVESVAWVTERKDVLFGLFYLIGLFYYIKGKQEGFSKRIHTIIAVSFILSLLSKIQAVFLPVSFVLIDYYLSKEGKLTLKSILTKTPYFIGSIIIGLVNIYFLKEQGSISEQAYQGIERLFIGSFSLTVYYIKALIPYRLSPLYPYPASLGWYFYPSILSFIATAGLLWYAYIKKWKVLFFGIGFFITNIFLLLQIFGAGQGFLADRFTYIAYIGLFFIMAYYLNQLIERKVNLKIPVLAITGVFVLAYAYITFQQCKIWKDSGTLWTHVIKHYPNSTLPWGNRANFYRDEGMVQRALADYSHVIKLKPNKPEPYNSRARLYFNFENKDSLLLALQNYNKAIELDPTNAEYIVNRGATYARLGDNDRAIANLNQAEEIDPSFANLYLNRSVIYNQNGQYPEALRDIDTYLKLKPNFPDMWYEKGRLSNYLKKHNEALTALNTAISMQRKGIYYFERAKVNYHLGNITAAKQDITYSQQFDYKGSPQTIQTIMNAQ